MMTPDLPFWTRLLIRIAVEAAGVVGAAWLLDRLIRPAFWRRALWQGAVVCLLALTASDLSGFGGGLASFLFGHARPEQKFVVWTGPAEAGPVPLPPPAAFSAPAPLPAPPAVDKPEIARPVWWPGLLWLAGGLAVLGRVAAAQILFISLRRRRPVVTQTDLKGRVHAILQCLAFRRKIRLLQSPGLTGPIAFGILRPSVALPVDFAAKFSRAEQDAMLAHELAHLASRDPLWYLLADLASAALWWLPQAWWARCRLHRASELAADEAAALFPQGPAALAECLVILGRQMTQCPAASRMGVEGGGFHSNLAERVQRLLRLADAARQPIYSWRAHAARMGAIISISAAAVGLSGCLQSRNAVKQPTLQANLSQSWNASPASTVWHSALPPQKPAPSSAPRPVKFQPAQPETASLGMGTFHVEPNSCIQALRHLFPKDGDVQAGAMLNRFFEGVGINLTNNGSFTLLNPRTGDILARATMRNLDSMAQAIDLLNKIPPVDSVDQAKKLVNQSRTTGSIFLDKQPERASPKRGQQRRVSDWERAALEKGQQIRVIPLDTNTFLQGLQEVFPQIIPRPTGATEATGGLPYLVGTNGVSGRNSLFTQCFASIGINLTNNDGCILFDQRTGAVLVCAASQNMEVVDHVIHLLNQVPPQVQIDVRFVSIKREGTNALGYIVPLSSLTNIMGLAGASRGIAPSSRRPPSNANPSGIFPGPGPAGSNPGQIAPAASDGSITGAALRSVAPNAPISGPSPAPLGTITGILTDPQFRVAIRAIEQREGADILSAPRITTESGRQAHVAVADIVDIITNTNSGTKAGPTSNSTTPFVEGPALDVIPTVNADGYTINLVLNATMKEFLGYDMQGQIVSQSNGVSSPQTGVPTNATPPVPRFRTFSETTAVNVWDGQTVLLGGPMKDSDPSQKLSTNSQREDVMVFITATIIDPAGNRVHKEEDMPFAKESVPPQTQGPGAPK